MDVTPPGDESISLIEHFPYGNIITWEIIVQYGVCESNVCATGPNHGSACNASTDCSEPLNFTGGTATLYDEDGNVMDSDDYSIGRFEEIARWWGRGVDYVPLEKLGICNVDSSLLCANAGFNDPDNCGTDNPACDARPNAGFIPAGGKIGIPFPLERIGHNVVPASSEMAICFEEYGNTPGNCPNPLEVLDVVLEEYRSQEAYIYPLGNPDVECVDAQGDPTGETPTLRMFNGAGHEINSNHRFARNQRYAYDVGVSCGNNDRRHITDTNEDWYIYGQPVLALAAGDVVAYEGGHPENDMPPDKIFLPDGGFCNTRDCAGVITDTCVPNPDPTMVVMPGSGNEIVLYHPDSGERTNYTHMITDSNDDFMCGLPADQGEEIGQVGNSGNSSGPHIHLSTLTSDAPEINATSNWPNYWTNVFFSSAETLPVDPGLPPQSYTRRRQLDVGMPTVPHGLKWETLPIPAPLPANADIGASESEPNNTLGNHNFITIPAAVSATLEDANVGDLAVRGDAIEDVYRFDLNAFDQLRIDLAESGTGENLDIYALTEDLRVINPTHEGTSPTGIERMCLDLDAGAYYLMVSNVDFTTTQDAPYDLSVVSDLQTISVSIEGGAGSVEVDENCEVTVNFTIDFHDNCCLDEDLIDELIITPSITAANASVGAPVIDSVNVVSERDITVTGHVVVSDLTSCPAELRIDAEWQDCSGNVVSTMANGGEDFIDVLDTLPPMVSSDVALSRLWPPEHDLIDVGFTRTATDNCDADVAQTLMTEVWADEMETAETGDGNFAPDAKDPNETLRLRSERIGSEDGRIYLMTSSAADACGNSSYACTTVGVAASSSNKAAAALNAQEAATLQYCMDNGIAPPEYFEIGLSEEIGPKQ
jgi:hypothetical protein